MKDSCKQHLNGLIYSTTETFLPIIGCRQHGEVYFQLNITHSPLNRLEYKSRTKWAFSKWKQSVSASPRCTQASFTPFDQSCQNTFPHSYGGTMPNLREIFRSQPCSHLYWWSLEACCSQVCLWEHWSTAIFLLAWIPENRKCLLSVQNKDDRRCKTTADFWLFSQNLFSM